MVRLLQILLLLCVLNVSLLSEAFVRDHSVSPAVTGSQHSRLYFSDERKYWQTRENDILSGEVALKERLRKYEAEALKRKTAAKNKVVNNTSAVSTTVSTNQGKTDGLSNQADESNQWKIPLPFMNLQSVGAKGRWEERKGNFVLRPPGTTRPFAVIHFMGGAFVGAAPHLTYRYLLESLAQEGYVIVATPYRLDMDYLRSCDSILSKFDALAVELAEEYGALPVVGMGHSCGALLEVLITSLFPGTPRAVNILISFNNRPASEAIPSFNEIIAPLAGQIMGDSSNAKTIRNTITSWRKNLDNLLGAYARSPLAPVFVGKEINPLFRQTVEIVDQLPELLQTIANGQREFYPSPTDTKEACRRMYRARRTLLIKFENDDLDESEDIEKVLREANTIMRMKRPMVEMEVNLKTLSGTHITPLTQNPYLDVSLFSPLELPEQLRKLQVPAPILSNFIKTVDEVKEVIADFLEDTVKTKSI